MFEWLKTKRTNPLAETSVSAGTAMSAGTELPTPITPKATSKQATLPSFVRSATPNPESALPLLDRRLANTDITSLRNGQSSRQVIKDFVRSSPDLSAAVTANVRVGITSGYTAVANNPDGTINPEATAAVAAVITRLNIINDYSVGYDDAPSIRSLSETWAREVQMYGGMAGELVLDKMLMPYKIQPVSISQLRKYPSKDGKRAVPRQVVGGVEINLDIPTFFMVELDQDTTEAYSSSPIEPALQAVLFSAEFMNDIRRIVKKALHPRMVVTIDEEKFRKSIPQEIAQDQNKVIEYMNNVLASAQEMINGLEPEEALVLFDSMKIEVKDHGNTNLSGEYTVISAMQDAKMAAGAKVLPTVLGHANSTANAASAETLLFMKYAEGTVTAKLNEMFSKILTLSVRLLGHDVFVTFAYNPIDLKPKSELEAFEAMKQSRLLDQLSLGFITDEDCCIQLTGRLPPKGYVNKSGTGFRKTGQSEPTGDGYNGASNGGSTLNQNLKPTTPTSPKSQNGGKSAEVIPILANASE